MHAIIDAYSCTPMPLSSPTTVTALIVDIARTLELHIQHIYVQAFPGPAGAGVSGVALISESHINVHTWPERELAQLCIHSCNAFPVDHVVALVNAAFDIPRATRDEMVKTIVLDR